MPEVDNADGASSCESSTSDHSELQSLYQDVGLMLERMDKVETSISELQLAALSHGDSSSDQQKMKQHGSDGVPPVAMGATRIQDHQLTKQRDFQSSRVFPASVAKAPTWGVKGAPTGVADDQDRRIAEDAKVISSPVPSHGDEQKEGQSQRQDPQGTDAGSGARTTTVGEDNRLAECLPHSVYVWACGEKEKFEDEDVNMTDIVVGWLTLAGQMMAYVVLIVYAENYEGANYSMYSVFLAMFLMVSTSASDIRAGYILLFRGSSHAQRVFGSLLLISAALLVIASLRVLFMEAENNAELVIGATTVLFIEDVDNKLMRFMIGIPQKWRLFWMLESVGISFWLALVGIQYLGDSEAVSPLSDRMSLTLEDIFPSYFVMVCTPGAVTMWALTINFSMIKAAEAYRDNKGALGTARSPQPGKWQRLRFMLPRIVKEEASFVLAVLVWFTVSTILSAKLAWNMSRVSADEVRDLWTITPDVDILVIGCTYIVSVCTFAGLIRAIMGSMCRTDANGPRRRWYPLFVGWGCGSFIGVLFNNCNVPGTLCPPWVPWSCSLVVFSSAVFLFAEVDFLGRWIAERIELSVAFLRKSDGFVHWSVVCSAQFLMIWWIVRINSSTWFQIFS